MISTALPTHMDVVVLPQQVVRPSRPTSRPNANHVKCGQKAFRPLSQREGLVQSVLRCDKVEEVRSLVCLHIVWAKVERYPV
jgi:hypothetical protein